MEECLREILEEKIIGDLSAAVNSYCGKLLNELEHTHNDELMTLLSDNFFNIMKEKKILFPSSIRNSFYCGTNALLSSSQFTQDLRGHLLALADCSSETLNVFIGNVILKLCNAILVFSIKHMRSVSSEIVQKTEYKKRSRDSIDSKEFRQLVYHIGGSVVNGFFVER